MPRIARELNALRAVDSERFLYGSTNESGIEKLALKYKDTKRAIQFSSGFGPDTRAKVVVAKNRKENI